MNDMCVCNAHGGGRMCVCVCDEAPGSLSAVYASEIFRNISSASCRARFRGPDRPPSKHVWPRSPEAHAERWLQTPVRPTTAGTPASDTGGRLCWRQSVASRSRRPAPACGLRAAGCCGRLAAGCRLRPRPRGGRGELQHLRPCASTMGAHRATGAPHSGMLGASEQEGVEPCKGKMTASSDQLFASPSAMA